MLPLIWNDLTLIGPPTDGSYGRVYKCEYRIADTISYRAVKVIDIPRDPSEITSFINKLNLPDSDSEAAGKAARLHFRQLADAVFEEIKMMETLRGLTNIVSIDSYCFEEFRDRIGYRISIRMEYLTPMPAYQRTHIPDEEEILKIGCDLCDALTACRRAGIVHRDVKPDNIFRAEHGNYKLGDFGTSRLISPEESMTIAGTPSYMAPRDFPGRPL